ncbi:hypothetical protein QM354_03010 [Streptococcus sp. OMI633]|uniref:SAG1386/EF1546 family surface-associated protein n=1 Tax=unclassified Streptococcus TaxID=2608887 RepID=UPI0039C1ED61
MAKEPWEEDIYDDGEETLKRTSKLNGIKADRLLTILAIIFFVVVVAMVCLLIFLSTGGSNKTKQMSGFYNGETKVEQKSSAPAQTAKTEEESSTDEESEEGTITVQAGEGEAAIAARAGISIAQLEQLNPSHMSTGSWYANPGDVVKIQ